MNAKKKGNAGENRICFCGNSFYVYPYRVNKIDYGKFCSQVCYHKSKKGIPVNKIGTRFPFETRKKMSLARLGDKNPNWCGGVSKNNRSQRYTMMNSIEYKDWRKAVFERDNYTCVECGAKCGNGKDVTLNADHIKQWAYHPELRFVLSNGRTLCTPCHKNTETWGTNKKPK